MHYLGMNALLASH